MTIVVAPSVHHVNFAVHPHPDPFPKPNTLAENQIYASNAADNQRLPNAADYALVIFRPETTGFSD